MKNKRVLRRQKKSVWNNKKKKQWWYNGENIKIYKNIYIKTIWKCLVIRQSRWDMTGMIIYNVYSMILSGKKL